MPARGLRRLPGLPGPRAGVGAQPVWPLRHRPVQAQSEYPNPCYHDRRATNSAHAAWAGNATIGELPPPALGELALPCLPPAALVACSEWLASAPALSGGTPLHSPVARWVCWPQAIDKAISVVSMHTKPLRTEEAVKGLDLGAKSEAKLIELVTTGSLARNVAFLSDPHAQTLALVPPAR